jgi:hypothetical protein
MTNIHAIDHAPNQIESLASEYFRRANAAPSHQPDKERTR